MSRERREAQRLKLAKPILATLDGHSALILDIGVSGAFVEHRGRAVKGLKFQLSWRWQGEEVTFDAEVVRSTVVREGGEEGVVSHSATLFTNAHGDAEERLREMMTTFVGHILDAHRANASAKGVGHTVLARIGEARRARSRGLRRYQWDGKTWTSSPTDDRTQLDDGFTVAAYEDEDELATLCSSYQDSDEEGRRLIRLIAELSVRSATK
jgi:hypothetical protein